MKAISFIPDRNGRKENQQHTRKLGAMDSQSEDVCKKNKKEKKQKYTINIKINNI